MERKLMYEIGNLFTGYPFGVEAEQAFGTVELHGPFSTENEANTYMHELVETTVNPVYVSVKVVRIETPQAGKRVVLGARGQYEYAV